MANLTIKDLPDDLYADLKRSAAENRRSIAAQATVILERALGRRSGGEVDVLARARALRERSDVRVTQDDIRAAREEGRA